MIAAAHDLPQGGPALAALVQKPQRSLVAPAGRKSADDSSDTLKKLLAGIEPKIASEALARAETLGKLPPAQQTLLRCALAAASESFQQGETVQAELAKVKERQRQAEMDLLAESQAFCRRTALAEAQLASLRQDIAASAAENQARESRFRKHSRYLWMALGIVVSASVVYGVLLSAPAVPAPSGFAAAGNPVTVPEPQDLIRDRRVAAVSPPRPAVPAVAQALGRLDRALVRVSLLDVEGVLLSANRWLAASGAPPCTIELAEGETSLLIGPRGLGHKPLTSALARCADAVEHVTQ